MSANIFADACRPLGVSSSDRPAWLAARRSFLTASDLAAILGKDPHRSALDVWVDKTQPPLEDEEVTIEDPRFWGLALEQPIAQTAASYYGWEYEGAGELLQSIEFPFLGCTLDGVVRIEDREDWGVYEGKTTSVWLRHDWQAETEMPLRVLIQAQQQLMVTRAPYNQVFCLIGGFIPRRVLVEPHLAFQEKIAEAAEYFMGLVRRGEQPDPAHNSQTALDRLYPEEMLGKVVDLPYQACEWEERLQAIRAEEKALKLEKNLLKNRLRATMGDAQYGCLPHVVGDKGAVKWGTERHPAHTVEETTFRKLLTLKALPPGLRAVPRRLVPVADPEAEPDDDMPAPPIRLQGRRRR